MENRTIRRFEAGRFQTVEDPLVPEARISLFLNEQEIVQILSLPESVEELALGFLFSEGLIQTAQEVRNINFVQRSMAVFVELFNQEIRPRELPIRSITSGCGRGTTFVSPLHAHLFPPLPPTPPVPPADILRLMKELQSHSSLFQQTGGVHTAALAENGVLVKAFDDIGRHNAVDKVLGFLLRSPSGFAPPTAPSRLLLTTGRISSEIVLKTVRGRFPLLVSHSAPTSGAVQLAEAMQVTLVGFARPGRFSVYTHPDRISDS